MVTTVFFKGFQITPAALPTTLTPPMSTGEKILAVIACAQEEADHYSIAGLLGAKKGSFLGDVAHAFAGNSISGVIDISEHMSQAMQDAWDGNSRASSADAAQVGFDVELGGTAQGVITSGTGNPFAQGIVGTVTDATLEGAAEVVGEVKVGVDAAIFSAALGYCAQKLDP